ncbi:hypothetical protein TNCV_2233081 [Trichonephila clavipes]|nr:hypothetical protein TNCV_2233081 [Trichonephila clavipes]
MQLDVLVESKSSAKVLCGVMNLPAPLQRFNKKESGLDRALETVATVRAIENFQRSESLHDLRYTKCLVNDDSRACKAVKEMQPYGDLGNEKLECVGYVEKRMDTRLRALKLKMKGKKLSDKK